MKKKQSDPKYLNQIDELNAVDKIFGKSLKERDNLVNENPLKNHQKIRTIDLKLSMCIKKRAKLTQGGYNYIPKQMWDWEPYFTLDKNLLPKTVK